MYTGVDNDPEKYDQTPVWEVSGSGLSCQSGNRSGKALTPRVDIEVVIDCLVKMNTPTLALNQANIFGFPCLQAPCPPSFRIPFSK